MKKMTQFVKIINVQAIKINPTETSIIATMEHLMVNFRQKIAQIVIQNKFMKLSLKMDYAWNAVDWKVIEPIDHLFNCLRIRKGKIIEKCMINKS